jgi:hypothetical protein
LLCFAAVGDDFSHPAPRLTSISIRIWETRAGSSPEIVTPLG